MENHTIKARITALRSYMNDKRMNAFIIPSTDPHLSEYVAPHWQSREWISGFTGSAGTVVVTLNEAALWTDSRYFLQAAEQLRGTDIQLMKDGLPETPSIEDWLMEKLQPGDTVGFDGYVFSTAEAKRLITLFKDKAKMDVDFLSDPMDTIWTDRPALPSAPALVYPTAYAGKDAKTKLSDIRKVLSAQGMDALLVSALDEIAWTLNLRGTDVHCNPVIISYLFISQSDAHLFLHPQKVTPEVQAHLQEAGVTWHDYADIQTFAAQIKEQHLLISDSKTNIQVFTFFDAHCHIHSGTSPIAAMKAIRNDVEIAGIRHAMQRDGVALVKFFMWLEKAVPKGKETEISVDRKLHELRAAQPLYIGESFDTIAGYGPHAAIVHYEATPETDVPLKPRGFLLLDSGAQYLDGTTDITRTVALGPLTQEEKEDYTLILKGHIDLAMAVFPKGTRGAQLDVLARLPLWQRRLNYLHGTGHGVGHYLNVHEGPQSIRMQENPVPLEVGMVTSNEPGIYKADSHGIRTENLVLTVPAGEGMFGSYLKFETLTLCPIDKRPILREMLTNEEVAWLNAYHQQVYDALSPDLNFEERYWLAQATSAI
ncbi:MAG: aminopeptidase P family protein [Bacteroidaceae bacterium]|nr:aminopeptidase P family protein [Bacteroidaceae bacterium]